MLAQKRTQAHIVVHMHVRIHSHIQLPSPAVSGLQGGVGSGKWSFSCEWGHTKGSEQKQSCPLI